MIIKHKRTGEKTLLDKRLRNLTIKDSVVKLYDSILSALKKGYAIEEITKIIDEHFVYNLSAIVKNTAVPLVDPATDGRELCDKIMAMLCTINTAAIQQAEEQDILSRYSAYTSADLLADESFRKLSIRRQLRIIRFLKWKAWEQRHSEQHDD